MAAVIRFLNRLLPFATPGTPLLQDLVHLAAVCAILYFGPQLQERFRLRQAENANDVVVEEVHAPQQLPVGRQGFPPVAHVEDEQQDEAESDDGDDDGDDDLNERDDAPPGNEDPRIPEGQAGPVQNPNLPTVRDVGAKKAKSMARRDQRRAYHEFQRSQGEAQRARDAEGAAERDAALAAEKERRRVVAAEVGGDADADWVERLLHGTGILGKKGGMMTIVTGKGWVVQVGEDDMREVYKRALQQHVGDEDGKVNYTILGELLEKVLRKRRDTIV
nr:hypothetical protein CFP56_54976 [Quercus suber]POF24054.1 hypothetical protein CFP56_54990 [Quercus suber]